MGRRTKLTPDLQKQICAAIRMGMPKHVAAAAYGVSSNTHYEWMARGRGEDPERPFLKKYAVYAKAIERADAEGHGVYLQVVAKAAIGDATKDIAGDPALALQVLKARYGKDWANVERIEHSGPDGKPIGLNMKVQGTVLVLPMENDDDDPQS